MALSNIVRIGQEFNRFIVTPKNEFGVAGFVFDVEGDARSELTTEITDHFTETNAAIQDHIAVRPERITLRNYVGELTYERSLLSDILPQKLAAKLARVEAYLPQLSAGAAKAQRIFEASKSVNLSLPTSVQEGKQRVADLWALIKNQAPQLPKQQAAYQFFKAMQRQKVLVSVQTPFVFLSSMAIESITAIQEEDSRFISEFSITLKEMRFARTETVEYEPEQLQGRTVEQRAPVVNNGNMPGFDLPFDSTVDIMDDPVFREWFDATGGGG